jgi:hypothetical protein
MIRALVNALENLGIMASKQVIIDILDKLDEGEDILSLSKFEKTMEEYDDDDNE